MAFQAVLYLKMTRKVQLEGAQNVTNGISLNATIHVFCSLEGQNTFEYHVGFISEDNIINVGHSEINTPIVFTVVQYN